MVRQHLAQLQYCYERELQRSPELAGKVVQRYAYSKVTSELKAKGYQIAREEKQPDGTVKVVLQRWR